MKKILLIAAAIALAFGCTAANAQTKQTFKSGWDKLDEPLDYRQSYVEWQLMPNRNLRISYHLHGAARSKLYQVFVSIFCTPMPGTDLGQFKLGACGSATRQGVTATLTGAELGVVTTDPNGTGDFGIVVGPVAPGIYNVEFGVRDGAGCNLAGGSGQTLCTVDFQSPGNYGTTTAITVQ